ncbi:MAG: hypothetical protein K2N03_01185, partial [Muribaculaceae bacterium]|nr:hypothetical protein [Muribaculaceae bacterium]
QLERWMTYKEGDVAFLFYYHKPWNSMLGYPAGHGQDSNLNDHNFHWGYFIRAAAFIAQYDKEWVNNYGDFINLLVRDVASNDRNDSMFPYLRAFSPYAGHCWANGTASLSLGNDQESTSEAMLFNTALILWGDVIGNKEMRDLGVCLYANEYASIREYWLDVDKTNLDPSFHSVLASRVFGNAYDDENFWGGGIAGSYGIQIYPLQSGSFYFMNDPEYVERLWAAMTDETGILRDEDNPNIWYDTWIRFIAMKNPEVALDLYSKTKHLGEKFGESQAYTYQWIHALEIFGQPNMSIYASHPLAMVFENDGVRTYIARNNNSEPISVIFSDGKTMTVDANTLYYEQEGEQNPSVSFFSLENRYSLNKVYTLNAKVRIPNESDIKVDDVEFFINNNSIGKGYSNDGVLYTIDWTPTILGKNYIKAILSCDDENKYSSQVCEINVVNENTPEELSCIFTDTEATEGSFNAPYTVTCTTKGRNVEILFSCSGNYQGFVGPYLFDETNGFREIMMNEVSKGLYKITLSGLEDGTYIRFRVKIAYTAGLGITKQFTYKVGSFCETSGIEEIYLVNGDIQFNSISSKNGWTITGHCPGAHMTLWGADGKLIREFKYDSDSFFVDNTNLSNGIYLLHVSTPNAQKSLKLVK